MKVFIITNSQFPHGGAPVKRRICYAKALLSRGVDCRVIVFSRTERRGKPSLNTVSKGEYEGVPFEYLGGSNVRSGIDAIAKLESLFLMLRLLVFLFANLRRGDVVFSYANDKFTGCMDFVIGVTHLRGAKFVHELSELPYGRGRETDSTISGRERILNGQFPKYDGVVAISDALVDLAKRYMNRNAKVLKVPILVEYEKYALENECDEEHQYIFHSGTLTEQKDGILGMIEAFGMAKGKLRENTRFVCAGDVHRSPCRGEIDELIAKYALQDRVFFTGFLPYEELTHYLKCASLVIINKHDNLQNRYGFSTKLGEYMAAGKAIIITKVGEAMNWLEDGKSAVILDRYDSELLADAMVRVLDDSELRQRIGNGARKVCRENFDCLAWGERLKSYFMSL